MGEIIGSRTSATEFANRPYHDNRHMCIDSNLLSHGHPQGNQQSAGAHISSPVRKSI